jgi:hypothetical protein
VSVKQAEAIVGVAVGDSEAEWLEREYDRWSFLHSAAPVPGPEAGVGELDRAHRIDERLRELAAKKRSGPGEATA